MTKISLSCYFNLAGQWTVPFKEHCVGFDPANPKWRSRSSSKELITNTKKRENIHY